MKVSNNFNSQLPKTTPSFKGSLSNTLLKGGALRKFSEAIEYNGYSMSSASLLGLFYLAVVGFRYVQAYDKYDRQEILRRDLISLTALTFLAQTLRKGLSEACSKKSGLVLTHKPENFKKSGIGSKLWNYIYPESEYQPLNGDQIVAKYSKVDQFKEGMADFCKYIHEEGGNLKKVLSMDGTIKTKTEEILGKSIQNADAKEIIDAFSKANHKKPEALKAIYSVLEKPDNIFIKKAKNMNNFFGFLSTFILTPALIIWIAKSNEKMTKERVKNDLAAKEANKNKEINKTV